MSLTRQDNQFKGYQLDDGLFDTFTFTAGGANTYPKGLILARNTTNNKLEVYVSGGPNGTGTPAFVLPNELVTTGAGDTTLRAQISGTIRKAQLLVWNGGTPIAPTEPELDTLRSFDILNQSETELMKLDN